MITEALLLLFFVCNAVKLAESEAYWPLIFKSVIDSWSTRSAKNITYGTILYFDAVCVGSVVITLLQNSKQTIKREV